MMLTDEEKSKIDFRFIHGDITVVDWSDGDVIFANSTCFDDDLMDKVTRLAEKTRPGTFILTITNRYTLFRFNLIITRLVYIRF